jgi:hypothetical protein
MTPALAEAPPPGVIAIITAGGIICLGLLAALARTLTSLKRDIRSDDEHRQHTEADQRPADPSRFTVDWDTRVDLPERWARQHGYRAVGAFGGYIIQRGTEPPIVVTPGSTLLWDGQNITIQEAR